MVPVPLNDLNIFGNRVESGLDFDPPIREALDVVSHVLNAAG